MSYSGWLLFGERLRNQRISQGFTQEYMAEKLDISLRYYQMLEEGSRGTSVKVLMTMSKLLSVSIDYLLFGEIAYPASPLSLALESLTPEQQKDALEMLALYIKACKSPR